MNYFFSLVLWTLSVTIFIFYYKSSTAKIRRPYAFVKMLLDFRIISNEDILTVLAPIIITIECLASVFILMPATKHYGALLGIGLHLMYIVVLSINHGKEIRNSCGCFELNIPSKAVGKNILANACFILLFICIISLQKELRGFTWNILH